MRGPYDILLTNKKSPTSRDFSIDGVGMVKASRSNHLMMVAAMTANKMASAHSRTADFGFFFSSSEVFSVKSGDESASEFSFDLFSSLIELIFFFFQRTKLRDNNEL